MILYTRAIALLVVLAMPFARLFPQWMQTNGPYGAEVTVVVADGSDLFAGTRGAGVFKSSDGGTTWKNLGLASEEVITSLVAIPVGGSANEHVLFAGVGGNVYRSTDRGFTWQPAGTGLPSTAVKALCALGGILLAGTEADGIFRSTNNGATWNGSSSGLRSMAVSSLQTNGTTLFAGASGFGGGVFRSTDGGLSWTVAANGLTAQDITSLGAGGSYIYAGTRGEGVFRTSDNGNSWSHQATGISDIQVSSLAVIGTKVFAATLGAGIYGLSEDGTTWNQTNWGLSDAFVNSLAVSGQTMIAGTMNGVFLSSDLGSRWCSANVGLPFWSVNALGMSADGSTLLVGTSAGGVYRTIGDGSTMWDAPNGGLKKYNGQTFGAYVFAVQGQTVLAGTNGDSLVYSSKDNGLTWTGGYLGLPNIQTVSSMLVLGNTILAGTGGGGVYRSTDNGRSWIESNTGMNIISGVRSLVRSGSYVFAGTSAHGVYRSSDNGVTWTAKNQGLQELFVTSLAVKLNSSGSNTLVAGIGGGIFRSKDDGVSWTAVKTGLPQALTVNAFIVVGDDIYAGTDGVGIYKSTNDGVAWSPFNEGLTDLTVNAFAVAQSGKTSRTIFAGTSSQGVFRIQTFVAFPTVAPVTPVQVAQGLPFWVEVRVGDPKAVKGLYGVSLKLKSRNTSCTYVDGSAVSGDFVGKNPISFFRRVDQQTLDLGVTKSASPGVDGTGTLAKAQFVATSTGVVEFSVLDVLAIDQFGSPISLDTMGASAVVVSSTPLLVPVALPPNEPGQPFWVEIHVGENKSVKGLYGISFKLKSDNGACTYVDRSGVAGSFLGSNPISFFQSSDPRTVDIGVTRSAPPVIDGSGVIAKVQFTCTAAATVRFSVLDIVAIDQAGNAVVLDTASTSVSVSAAPSLMPSAPAQVAPGSPFWIDIRIGDTKAVQGLYGISFKLKCSEASCMFVEGSAASGSFLGTGQLSFFQKMDSQTIDASTTRASGAGVSGNGVVVRAQFIAATTGNVTFTVQDVLAIGASGAVIPVNAGTLVVKVVIGGTTGVETEEVQPRQFALQQNYPNPFNPATSITFSLPRTEFTVLEVYSLLGKKVATLCSAVLSSGEHTVRWQPQDLPSGMYVYRIQAGEMQQLRKLVYLK
jgi:hypothetical protein